MTGFYYQKDTEDPPWELGAAFDKKRVQQERGLYLACHPSSSQHKKFRNSPEAGNDKNGETVGGDTVHYSELSWNRFCPQLYTLEMSKVLVKPVV